MSSCPAFPVNYLDADLEVPVVKPSDWSESKGIEKL